MCRDLLVKILSSLFLGFKLKTCQRMSRTLHFITIKFMNGNKSTGDRNRLLRWIFGCLIVLGILVVAMLFVAKPRVFTYHSRLTSSQNIPGKVFGPSDGVFIVRLDSGSQLTLEQDPPRIFLLTDSKNPGFRIWHFLFLPASAIGGVDLSKSEGFNRQVPVIKDGMVIFNDPMNQSGVFSFPLKK